MPIVVRLLREHFRLEFLVFYDDSLFSRKMFTIPIKQNWNKESFSSEKFMVNTLLFKKNESLWIYAKRWLTGRFTEFAYRSFIDNHLRELVLSNVILNASNPNEMLFLEKSCNWKWRLFDFGRIEVSKSENMSDICKTLNLHVSIWRWKLQF